MADKTLDEFLDRIRSINLRRALRRCLWRTDAAADWQPGDPGPRPYNPNSANIMRTAALVDEYYRPAREEWAAYENSPQHEQAKARTFEVALAAFREAGAAERRHAGQDD